MAVSENESLPAGSVPFGLDPPKWSRLAGIYSEVTRLVAIVPTVIVTAMMGESGTAQLLILSQVILSLMLSFAVVPLVMFTGDKLKMGPFANPGWMNVSAWVLAAVIAVLNAILLWQTFAG